MTRYKSPLDLPPHMRQQAQAQGFDLSPPRRKYGNVPTEVDGHLFGSKLEADIHHDLDLQVAHGLIYGHLAHVTFRLPSRNRMELDQVINRPQTYNCSKHATPYVCPICAEVNSIPTLVLADVKGGIITDAWRCKCRELEHALGVKVEIIQR